MKVTIYTINDEESSYCKDAKDFLTAHNIQFEEKDVEHDRQALAEMQRASEDFAGVPVIVIDDNGQKKVLKGFTQQEVEQALGLPSQPEVAPQASVVQETVAPAPVAPTAPVSIDQNINQMDQSASVPPAMAEPMPEPMAPVAETQVSETAAPEVTTPAVSEDPVVEEHDDQLKGIMDTLSSSASSATAQPAPAIEATPAETPIEPAVPNPIPETPLTAEPSPSMDVAPSPVSEEPIMPQVSETPPSVSTDAALPSIPDFPQK